MNEEIGDLSKLAAAMHRAGHAWREAINRALTPFALSHLQWAVLELVSASPGLRQTELARQIGIEGPSLVRVLDGLESARWVERRPCSDDRRAKRLFLTEQSKTRLNEVRDVLSGLHATAIASMDAGKREKLVELIEEMSSNLLAKH